MTKEQIYVLKARMKEGPQYVKYFMVDTLLEQNQTLTEENEKLKKDLKLLEERMDDMNEKSLYTVDLWDEN
jgi:regulator of replication initiation timing